MTKPHCGHTGSICSSIKRSTSLPIIIPKIPAAIASTDGASRELLRWWLTQVVRRPIGVQTDVRSPSNNAHSRFLSFTITQSPRQSSSNHNSTDSKLRVVQPLPHSIFRPASYSGPRCPFSPEPPYGTRSLAFERFYPVGLNTYDTL